MASLSWVELHGAITHLPLAFLLAAPVFEIGALLLKKPEWRIVSFWLLASGVLLAVPALVTGWITASDLHFTGPGAAPPAHFVWHRLAAFVTTGLAALALLWRVRTGDQPRGAARAGTAILGLAAAMTVAATGFFGGRMVFGGGAEYTPLPVPTAVAPSSEVISPQLIATGAKLFTTLPCLSCHRMAGTGGVSGPDLTHEASRHADPEWHIRHLKDPQKIKPGSGMPPFDTLSPGELQALAAYLASRK